MACLRVQDRLLVHPQVVAGDAQPLATLAEAFRREGGAQIPVVDRGTGRGND